MNYNIIMNQIRSMRIFTAAKTRGKLGQCHEVIAYTWRFAQWVLLCAMWFSHRHQPALPTELDGYERK